ncbi:mycothione reductase [Pseudonocardia ailaonensis]|uniref:Mycothione reductase n=1 Tax=Pseudonocardia ailaonensis TaxID=367279 RepID=A0ABN2N6R2_9PSEU
MTHHDLLVLGTGSGNMVVDEAFSDLGVAIVEEERRFGGTCLNVGCIPTKILAHTADVVETVRTAGDFDVAADLRGADWAAVRERVSGRTDPLAQEGRDGRIDTPWITVHTGTARFTGPRTLTVDGDVDSTEVTADRIVIAAGSRPAVPPPVAGSGLPFHTSDTIMRIDALPRHLAVLGGGYIAAELAHVFHELGCAVTIVEAADSLLGRQDGQVAEAYGKIAAERYSLCLGRELERLEGEAGALRLVLDDGAVVEADMLLVAVGRIPNGDRLDLGKADVDTHGDGRIVVDDHQRTTADGIWALGDVCTPVPLKHVANREAEVVRHNLLHPDDLVSADHDLVPSAVFTDPQIASIGPTEEELREAGTPYLRGVAEYSDTAYGWALGDPPGFCKVLVDPDSGRVLGAHLIGPDAPALIPPLVLAATHGLTAEALVRRTYWIHPALPEVVQQALDQTVR